MSKVLLWQGCGLIGLLVNVKSVIMRGVWLKSFIRLMWKVLLWHCHNKSTVYFNPFNMKKNPSCRINIYICISLYVYHVCIMLYSAIFTSLYRYHCNFWFMRKVVFFTILTVSISESHWLNKALYIIYYKIVKDKSFSPHFRLKRNVPLQRNTNN